MDVEGVDRVCSRALRRIELGGSRHRRERRKGCHRRSVEEQGPA